MLTLICYICYNLQKIVGGYILRHICTRTFHISHQLQLIQQETGTTLDLKINGHEPQWFFYFQCPAKSTHQWQFKGDYLLLNTCWQRATKKNYKIDNIVLYDCRMLRATFIYHNCSLNVLCSKCENILF